MNKNIDELLEIIKTSPPGTIKLFQSRDDDPPVEQQLENNRELAARIEIARRAGCLIEVIALRLMYIDAWLRLYFDSTSQASDKREREFGRLLRQCFDLGFDKALYDELLAFNRQRIEATHGFVVGKSSYSEMQKAIERSDDLSKKVVRFVVVHGGHSVQTSGIGGFFICRGDQLVHVPRFLASLESSPNI